MKKAPPIDDPPGYAYAVAGLLNTGDALAARDRLVALRKLAIASLFLANAQDESEREAAVAAVSELAKAQRWFGERKERSDGDEAHEISGAAAADARRRETGSTRR